MQLGWSKEEVVLALRASEKRLGAAGVLTTQEVGEVHGEVHLGQLLSTELLRLSMTAWTQASAEVSSGLQLAGWEVRVVILMKAEEAEVVRLEA